MIKGLQDEINSQKEASMYQFKSGLNSLKTNILSIVGLVYVEFAFNSFYSKIQKEILFYDNKLDGKYPTLQAINPYTMLRTQTTYENMPGCKNQFFEFKNLVVIYSNNRIIVL